MKEYMWQVRCVAAREVSFFPDLPCTVHYLVKKKDVKAAVNKPCEYCKGHEWKVQPTSITEKEYFKKTLKDPDGTIGYQVTSDGTIYRMKA